MFHEGNFKQFDMSEFSEKHTVSKLIGSPPGYVGSGEGGELTEYVRHNPYCVLLFDEIEKAHVNVLQLFLQVLEYGCLTDSDGLEVNFKNTIIVMTSNIGAHKFDKLNSVGFGMSNNTNDAVVEELKKMYAPEFLNRLDETIVFDRLNDTEMLSVCDLLLKQLKKNIKSNTKMIITYDSKLCEHIAKLNKDDTYGARPLKRIITEQIETPLAEQIIDLQDGVRKIHITTEDDQVIFDICYNN
jgi:ATP-dependent Clp protease ATP-binding subunit ClpC